jgi:hypothetical protein
MEVQEFCKLLIGVRSDTALSHAPGSLRRGLAGGAGATPVQHPWSRARSMRP